MRALVISGGGSKGAFAGGVAQYLMENDVLFYKVAALNFDLLQLRCRVFQLAVVHIAANRLQSRWIVRETDVFYLVDWDHLRTAARNNRDGIRGHLLYLAENPFRSVVAEL